MKLLSKLLFMFSIVALITACGSDDEAPAPNIENAELAFSAQNPPIEIPSGLSSSSDQNASQINGQLQLVNSISNIFASFEAPSGAEKSNTPVGRKANNGRVAATQEDVVVYTYTATTSDGQGNSVTVSVAYQITDTGDDYVFELFYKFDGGDYIPYLYAQESKSSLREGYLVVYNIFDDENPGTESLIRFDWEENSAGVFSFSYDIFTARVELVVNPDNSGTMEIFNDGVKTFRGTWNAAGTEGTYAYYDENGTETDSGNWSS
ncbi:MAG: hypothetical protein ABJH05_06865 [Fulvivirga sp.]